MKKSAFIITVLGILILVSCNTGFNNFNKRKYLNLKNKPTYVDVDEANKNINDAIPYNGLIELEEVADDVQSSNLNLEQDKITNTQIENSTEDSDKSEEIRLTKKIDSKKTFNKINSKIASKNSSDYLLYLLLPLFGLSVFGIIRISRKKTLRVVKWASKNKIKSKFIIFGIQTCLGAIGFGVGHELSLLGYSFSDSVQYISGGIMSIAFIGLLYQKKIESLKSFYLSRIGHIIIGLSFLGLTIGTGNGLAENRKPVSIIGYSVDNFNGDYHDNIVQVDELDEPVEYKYSIALIVLFVILTIALLAGATALCCMAYCTGGMQLAIPAVLGCAALMFLIIWGMVEAVKRTATPKLLRVKSKS